MLSGPVGRASAFGIAERLLGELAAELLQRVLRHPQLGVGNGVVEVQEERALVRLLDESRRFLREQVVHVVPRRIDGDPLAVPPQVVGVLPVGVIVIQKPEGVVEALALRRAGGPRPAQPPLADDRRAVARRMEHLGDRGVLRAQGHVAMAPDPGVPGVLPGHQRGARRGADRAPGIVLGEPDALPGQAVELRRLEPRLAVGAEIAVAEIVGLDQQDVRLPRGGRILRLSPAGEGQGERKNQRNDGSGLSHGISGRVGAGWPRMQATRVLDGCDPAPDSACCSHPTTLC